MIVNEADARMPGLEALVIRALGPRRLKPEKSHDVQ